MSDDEKPVPREASTPAAAGDDAISAERLLAGRDEVRIELKGEIYRLRLTRRGRLILTK